jgi:hypothetical protein
MEKSSHHLWSAETDETGNVIINRSVAEREDLEEAEKEFARAIAASAWGFFGARLVDSNGFDRAEMPAAIRDRFNIVAKELIEDSVRPQKVQSWSELAQQYGTDIINDIRSSIVNGMQVRQASKDLNVPFVIAADLLSDCELVGKETVKEAVELVREGKVKEAENTFGKLASKVYELFVDARKTGSHKISIDEVAAKYWSDYYGEYGKLLVKDVKKRVRADLAYEWLRKCGIDEFASKYWSDYFSDSDYGKALTEVLPKALSPRKDKEE